ARLIYSSSCRLLAPLAFPTRRSSDLQVRVSERTWGINSPLAHVVETASDQVEQDLGGGGFSFMQQLMQQRAASEGSFGRSPWASAANSSVSRRPACYVRAVARPSEVLGSVVAASEREQLETFLDYLRDAVVRKARGVSEEDARRSPVPDRHQPRRPDQTPAVGGTGRVRRADRADPRRG